MGEEEAFATSGTRFGEDDEIDDGNQDRPIGSSELVSGELGVPAANEFPG